MKISERSNPARYQGALVSAALSSGVGHDAPDADLDQAATTAGLRPPALAASREAVRYALECPVDFMGDDSNQDIAQAVFDAASERRPLVVLDHRGRPVVMVPQPVEESV
ncbi:hypothetical protein [Streptomyces capitiformicae]|uniref:hypothetical protein n=1 Tax=Streptomyces capitiformicae TaxID=2014920 RepID=UPI0016768835|nr:hypothetical protein [Streptomyces capitiformicae]